MGAVLSREHELDAERFDVRPWPRDERCELRWVVDVSAWQPSAAEWEMLLQLLPHIERKAVLSMAARPDQQRALVSRLMQRRAVGVALGQPDAAVTISRTNGGKPFEAGCGRSAAEPCGAAGAPNFNFNVAHDAGLVVLVADPVLLIGVDVTAPFHLRPARSALPAGTPVETPLTSATPLHGASGDAEEGGYRALRAALANVMTPDEWDAIDAAGMHQAELGRGLLAPSSTQSDAADARLQASSLGASLPNHERACEMALDEARVTAFRRQWSRKEAFVKARGDGLAFELRRVEFCVCRPPTAPPQQHTPSLSPAGPSQAKVAPVADAALDAASSSAVGALDAASSSAVGASATVAAACSAAGAASPCTANGRASCYSGAARVDDSAETAAVAASACREVAASPGRDLELAVASEPDWPSPAQNGDPPRETEPVLAAAATEAAGIGAPMPEEGPASWSRVYVDDALRPDWACWTHELRGGYVVSVARGPVSAAQDAAGAFRATFNLPEVPESELRARLATPPPPFCRLGLSDLVPEQRRAEYAAVVDPAGEAWSGPAGRAASARRTASGAGASGGESGLLADAPSAGSSAVLSEDRSAPWMHEASARQAAPPTAAGHALDDGCSVS